MQSILLILLLNFSSYNSDISVIRELYLASHESESNCNNFGIGLNSIEDSTSVLIKAYQACFYFIRCRFINSPIEKFISFKKGKYLLEFAIQEDPELVELRFLRYSIQKNLPKFLLYYDSIEKDANFIDLNINAIKDKESQEFIISALNLITK